MAQKSNKPLKKTRVYLYLVIILAIGLFFTRNSIDFSTLQNIHFSKRIYTGIAIAMAMLVLRDLGYVLRLRLLTDNKISFYTATRIILLWEFGSAITPGMIGGKAVAIYLLIKNKIRAAKASSVVLLAILLDEFVFVLLFPIIYSLMGDKMLHGNTDCPDWQVIVKKMPILSNVNHLELLIFLVLGFVLFFVVIAFLGIFIYPKWVNNSIKKLAHTSFFTRWQDNILEFGQDLYTTSQQFKKKNSLFWIKLSLYTFLSWFGRYLVGVAIVWGFSIGNFDFLEVYAKQYALWLMFYLPSTPGSSGIAEALFMAFYCEYIISGMSGAAALIWRIISYYIYLLLGIFMLFFGSNQDDLSDD